MPVLVGTGGPKRPREEAARADGDGQVGDRRRGGSTRARRRPAALGAKNERAHERKGVQVDPQPGGSPACADGLDQPLRSSTRGAATTTTFFVLGLPSGVSTPSPTLWKSSTTSFSGIAIASAAWDRDSGLEVLLLIDPRQFDLADDDLLIGHPEVDSPWVERHPLRNVSFSTWAERAPCRRPRRRASRPAGSSALTAAWGCGRSATETAARKSPSRSSPTLPRGARAGACFSHGDSLTLPHRSSVP